MCEPKMIEQSEILSYYAEQDRDCAYEKQWGYANPVAATYWAMRDALVFPAVQSRLRGSRHTTKVLEIGCGFGNELVKFERLGVPLGNLTGIDLVANRVDE